MLLYHLTWLICYYPTDNRFQHLVTEKGISSSAPTESCEEHNAKTRVRLAVVVTSIILFIRNVTDLTLAPDERSNSALITEAAMAI